MSLHQKECNDEKARKYNGFRSFKALCNCLCLSSFLFLARSAIFVPVAFVIVIVFSLSSRQESSFAESITERSTAHDQNGASGKPHKLHFPKEHSIGGLYLVPASFENTRSLDTYKSVGHGKGDSVIFVPADKILMLELNRYAFDHPEVISQASPEGIDAVKAKFSSMDDSEAGCDKIAQFLPHFSDALEVDVDHSDITDKGMAHLGSMKKLKSIHAFGCAIQGACFRELTNAPDLEIVEFGLNALKQENLAYLSKAGKLRTVGLGRCMLKDDAVKYLSKCSSVIELSVKNNHLSDKCLPYLFMLKKLKYLDIADTSISAKGLLTLAPLKLKALTLPHSTYTDEEKESFKKLLAGTRLDFSRPRSVDDYSRVLFAPTK